MDIETKSAPVRHSNVFEESFSKELSAVDKPRKRKKSPIRQRPTPVPAQPIRTQHDKAVFKPASKLIRIGKHKFITIRKYCGEPRINIRDYTYDGCGKLYSTKRGIMLTPAEWQQLKEQCDTVDKFLKQHKH